MNSSAKPYNTDMYGESNNIFDEVRSSYTRSALVGGAIGMGIVYLSRKENSTAGLITSAAVGALAAVGVNQLNDEDAVKLAFTTKGSTTGYAIGVAVASAGAGLIASAIFD